MKWIYLATAPDQLVAEMWLELLRNERIACLVRSGDTSSFLGVSASPCRIMVREDQFEKGKEVLEAHLDRQLE